ncbi:MAG: replicative DNA helicase [Rikenellaceae bacterium]
MAKEFKKSKNNSDAYAQLTQQPIGVVPPQAIELEESVLGALMLEKDSIDIVQEFLSPETFYAEQHKLIYAAISDLSEARQNIDLYTVTEKLKGEKNLEAAGGVAYLASLTQKVDSAANIEFHARIVSQKYVQRALISAATEIQRNSYDEAVDVQDLIAHAESKIFEIAGRTIQREMISAGDALKLTFDAIEEAGKNDAEFNGVQTGFTALDRITSGWQASDLIVVAARPSMGKTAFVLSMARNMVVDYNQGVAFFSLEMSTKSLIQRLLAGESGLPMKSIQTGKLTPEQWAHLQTTSKPIGEAPLYIDETPGISVFEFRSKARRQKLHNDIKIIMIDYLQLMTAGDKMERSGNREQVVSFISRTLKAIAKDLGIPIIALAQLSRAGASRGAGSKPILSDLRESGAIEQDADIVAFIHRPWYYGIKVDDHGNSTEGLAEIVIAKHRNGEVGDVPLRFIAEEIRFANYDELQMSTLMASQNGNYNAAPAIDEEYDDFDSPSNTPMGGAQRPQLVSNEFDIEPTNTEQPF